MLFRRFFVYIIYVRVYLGLFGFMVLGNDLVDKVIKVVVVVLLFLVEVVRNFYNNFYVMVEILCSCFFLIRKEVCDIVI